MEAKNVFLYVILLIGVGFVFITHYCDATDFDSINYGVHVSLDYNLSEVTLLYPSNNTEANWHQGINGDVNLSVRVYGDPAVFYRAYFFNRTGDTWTLINTSSLIELTDTYVDFNYTWNDLSNLSTYQWIVNISYNKTTDSPKWWNVSSEQSITYWNFSTPEYGIMWIQYDTISYGVSVDLEEEASPGQQFDSISFGVQAVIGENVTGGWTNYSDYWEFYKLDNRYDVYNIGDGVDINDIYKVYLQAQTTYDYLYDVYPSCNPDDTVDVNDYYMVYLNVD